MEVHYKREQERNYLLITVPEGFDEQGVNSQIEMIRRNQIPGLAPFHVEWEDNKKYYGYDITGVQPISRVLEFKKLMREETEALLIQIANLMERTELFLLDRDKVILEPEYIYVETDQNRYLFFYYPDQEGEYGEHIKRLSQYLFEKAEEQDTKLLEMILRLYRSCNSKTGPEPETLLSCLSAARNEAVTEYETEEVQEEPVLCEKERVFGVAGWFRWCIHKLFYRKRYREEELWETLEPEKLEAAEDRVREENPTELLYTEEPEESYPMLYGLETEEKVKLKKFPFLIGTCEEADYKPTLGTVSRFHLQIDYRSGAFLIKDLNSTNGTRLNGETVNPNQEKALMDGDTIWIGGLSYEFLAFDRGWET